MYRPALVVLLAVCLTSVATASDTAPRASSGSPAQVGDKVERVRLLNVELSPEGTLHGKVLDTSGKAISGVVVATSCRTTLSKTSPAVLSKTDSNGRFVVAMSRGTVCLLQIGDSQYPCRTWKYGTSPPKSVRDIALIVGDEPIVRGQNRNRNNCDNCEPNRVSRISTGQKYGMAAAALGGVAAYMALSRDNASE